MTSAWAPAHISEDAAPGQNSGAANRRAGSKGVIADETGVPFVGEKRSELTGLIVSSSHLLNVWPLVKSEGEAVGPFPLRFVRHGRNIVSLGMRREGQKF